MDFAERAARNEEIFRDVNKRIEEGAEQHSVSGSLPFHCECGGASCVETIEIPFDHYEAIVRERYHFVLIPGHEEPSIERILESEGLRGRREDRGGAGADRPRPPTAAPLRLDQLRLPLRITDASETSTRVR